MEEILLKKELDDVDTAIKELMQEKEGELNINTKPIKRDTNKKITTNKTLRDKLKRRQKEEEKKEEEIKKEEEMEKEKNTIIMVNYYLKENI